MAEAARESIATILFTDVVDSTALLQRLGDERAERVFDGHHRMLADMLATNGGEEIQWLGDGQMAAFASPADAVRCAVAMQQGAARPIDGERPRMLVLGLYREGGRWKSRVTSVAELGIPEGVRQVITRRLAQLSEVANRLLSAASAFEGVCRSRRHAARGRHRGSGRARRGARGTALEANGRGRFLRLSPTR